METDEYGEGASDQKLVVHLPQVCLQLPVLIILAVDIGQMEGGRSLGFTYGETMRYIILPQAIKNVIPALGNETITLVKETSIVGYVAIVDLTKAGDFIVSRTYQAFLPLIAVAIVYYIIVKIMTKILAVIERRLRQSDNR